MLARTKFIELHGARFLEEKEKFFESIDTAISSMVEKDVWRTGENNRRTKYEIGISCPNHFAIEALELIKIHGFTANLVDSPSPLEKRIYVEDPMLSTNEEEIKKWLKK